MGRGRVPGSQAWTSGIQGCVYAVMPQVKPVDQSDTQSTFLLLHLLTRVWSKLGCILFIIVTSGVMYLGLEIEAFGKVVV